MAILKDSYKNIEVVITIGQSFKYTPDKEERVNLSIEIYYTGESPIDTGLIIKNELDIIGSPKFSEFTKENTLKLTVQQMFHNSKKQVKEWIDSYSRREEFKEVVLEYFISKHNLITQE